MAIYHLHARRGSRNGGQSAHAKISYNARKGKYKRHRSQPDYVMSCNMPKWVSETGQSIGMQRIFMKERMVVFRAFEFLNRL